MLRNLFAHNYRAPVITPHGEKVEDTWEPTGHIFYLPTQDGDNKSLDKWMKDCGASISWKI